MPFRARPWQGEPYVGSRRMVVKRGEISKGMLTVMLKQLQIEKRDF